MPWDLLIRDGEVVTPEGVRRVDVAVEDGTIVEVAPGLSGNVRETIDATGLHVFPGLIDPHVHFNEPGRTEWEGFATGSSALAAGGGTCFFDMPLNSSPPTLDGESFDLKRAAAEANSHTDFGLWGGLTPGNLDKLEELADRGVVGFKAFMSNSGIEDFARADDVTLRSGMEIASRLGLVVAVHAESEEITSRLGETIRREKGRSWREYLDSRPVVAESEAIQRAASIAEETGCRLHIVHVSSSAGVSAANPFLAAGGRERDGGWSRAFRFGGDLSIETCPHYVLLNEADLIERGAIAKCAPPLRPPADVEALRTDLLAGNVHMVGSDHSPSPRSMKTGSDAFAIWGGIAGVQSTLSSLVTLNLPPSRIADLTATNAAARFAIPAKGRIHLGHHADVTLVDLTASYRLESGQLLDRHKLSPYVGRTFRGVVKHTIVRGHTVFRDGNIVAGDFRGKLITPARKGGVDA